MTFQAGDTAYALPIAQIREVAEAGRISCVPTLPRSCGGVMNWHGDALPIVAPELLLGDGAAPSEQPLLSAELVLVISDKPEESARLGLPIERVLGLVDGRIPASGGSDLVVDRRPIEGRVVSVLDPGRLVARAREVIMRSAVQADRG